MPLTGPPPTPAEALAFSRFTVPELTVFPAVADPQDEARFAQSLVGEVRTTALLWEEYFLARYPDLPFFIVRVADIRAALGSYATALTLYEQVEAVLGWGRDPVFDAFLGEFRASTERALRQQDDIDHDMENYAPFMPANQQNRPTTVPMIPMYSIREVLDEAWGSTGLTDVLQARYVNCYCVETNRLDDNFQLTPQSARRLAKEGFQEAAIECLPTSRITDPALIIAILEDTRRAFLRTREISNDPTLLKPDYIKSIHAELMRSSRILPDHHGQPSDSGLNLKYVNVGQTRTTTGKGMLIPGVTNIGCCRFEDVDSEMEYICNLARQWLRTFSQRHPLSIAAWLLAVLNRCQPFDDGNGRIARLIASVPLMQQSLPPLIISAQMRNQYYDTLMKACTGSDNLALVAELTMNSIKVAAQDVASM